MGVKAVFNNFKIGKGGRNRKLYFNCEIFVTKIIFKTNGTSVFYIMLKIKFSKHLLRTQPSMSALHSLPLGHPQTIFFTI